MTFIWRKIAPSRQKTNPLGSRNELGTTPLFLGLFTLLGPGEQILHKSLDLLPEHPNRDQDSREASDESLKDDAASPWVNIGMENMVEWQVQESGHDQGFGKHRAFHHQSFRSTCPRTTARHLHSIGVSEQLQAPE